ncbi:MAG TPA: TonB-dependent receptor [Bacteroidales bacterium]|nr:TonB-dependent receptor [Bacteroidales bacterium]
MKKYFILFLTILWGAVSFAQNLTVKDNVTQQPLEFVTIYSIAGNHSTVTNVRGQADVSDFDGDRDILIRLIGYQSRTMSWVDLQQHAFVVMLDPSQIYLDEVVVSASRWEQQSGEVPNKITTITPGQIVLQNPATAADLLELSGGVFMQKSQLGGGSPMIRGFAANRVLITVDGVRMNNAIFRSGNLQNVINVDPFALSSTEVIYGPGAVIYGSDAIGGVMNFYTLKPLLSVDGKPLVKGSAVARYASASNEMTGHFDVNVGWKKWALRTSASYTNFDDLKMGSNGPDEYLRPEYATRINGQDSVVANSDSKVQVATGYSQFNVMQKVRFQPNKDWDFNYGFHYSATSDVPRYDRLIRYKKGKLRSAEWYYGPQVWMMNNLSITTQKATGIYDKAALTVAHQYFEESRHDRDFGKSWLTNRTEKVDVVTANLDFDKRFDVKNRLYYGLEMALNKVRSTGDDENIKTNEVVPAASRYPDGSTYNSYAAYTSYVHAFNRHVTFQGGLRYNLITLDADFDRTYYPFPFASASLTNGALTGSAGISVKTDNNWLFSANLSTGFRAPNIDDAGKVFDSEPGSVVVPNPDLKPEYAYNAEISVTRRFADFLEIDLSVFYTHLDDALVRRSFLLDGKDSIMYDGALSGVQAIQNAASAFVYGFQLDAEADLPAGFGLAGHFNYQHGEEELDNGSTAPLRHAAPWYGRFHVTYTRARLKADLYAVFNGETSYDDMAPSEQKKDYMYAIDNDGNPYSPSWYTLNFKMLYQLTDYLMLTAGVENITDQRYRPYSSGIVAPGVNFIGSLRLTF